MQSVKGESEGGGIRAEFDIENPELWWTNDLSDKPEQALYTVSLELCDGETPIDKLEKDRLKNDSLESRKGRIRLQLPIRA